MNAPTRRIREEFDRIALLTEQYGNSGGELYYDYLLRQLPARMESALEIGCGSGAFTRRLAARARRVLALDLSPEMLRLAQARSANYPNIEYRLGDVMRLALPAAGFACVVSIATLHHLPLAPALRKMQDALQPNGTLIIHDLVADDGLWDRGLSALAYPLSALRQCWKTGRMRMPREVRQAWAEHGEGEVYLTPAEVQEMRRKHLPGARVKRHLLWRYTVVWRKRAAA